MDTTKQIDDLFLQRMVPIYNNIIEDNEEIRIN